MEAAKLNNSLRIKTKTGNFVIGADENLKNPSESNFFIMLNKNNNLDLTPKLSGAGDYEIKNIKISAFSKDENVSYLVKAEGIDVMILSSNSLGIKDLVKQCQVLILRVEGKINAESVASMDPNMVILWGSSLDEAVKILGKEAKTTGSKISVTRDRLPSELEVNVIN